MVHLPKLHPGQHFENLGMITLLLSKKPGKDLNSIGTRPAIEIASGKSSGDGDGACGVSNGTGGSGEESDEFDWQEEQQLPTDQDSGKVMRV